MSKTLSEIKDQYAKEAKYPDWNSFWRSEGTQGDWEEVCRRYATACCKATQQKCAEEVGPSVLLYKAIMQSSNIVIL